MPIVIVGCGRERECVDKRGRKNLFLIHSEAILGGITLVQREKERCAQEYIRTIDDLEKRYTLPKTGGMSRDRVKKLF